MPKITLSIPDEAYKKMKEHSEVVWDEIIVEAILNHLEKLEKCRLRITTKDILENLSSDFKASLDELELEKAVEGYRKMSDAEWKRTSTIQAN